MFSRNRISHNLLQHTIQTQFMHSSFYIQDRPYLPCSVAIYSNYIAAIHNVTYSPCTSICTPHPLTNTKHSWQNGTKCRDGVELLWCHSHLVWLVFEGSIPTCACFHSENFFVTFYYCLQGKGAHKGTGSDIK